MSDPRWPSRSEIVGAVNKGLCVVATKFHKSEVGVVEEVLTRSEHHPYGIKVRLECGFVGRAVMIAPEWLKPGVVLTTENYGAGNNPPSSNIGVEEAENGTKS